MNIHKTGVSFLDGEKKTDMKVLEQCYTKRVMLREITVGKISYSVTSSDTTYGKS